jgi:hypothetical protein
MNRGGGTAGQPFRRFQKGKYAAGWPGISAIVLGILLAVNFVSTGIGYIFISRMQKVVS